MNDSVHTKSPIYHWSAKGIYHWSTKGIYHWSTKAPPKTMPFTKVATPVKVEAPVTARVLPSVAAPVTSKVVEILAAPCTSNSAVGLLLTTSQVPPTAPTPSLPALSINMVIPVLSEKEATGLAPVWVTFNAGPVPLLETSIWSVNCTLVSVLMKSPMKLTEPSTKSPPRM